MKLKNKLSGGIVFIFTILMFIPAGQATEKVVSQGAQIGMLECHTVEKGSYSLLIHSVANVRCRFEATGGVIENYRGETGVGLGVDLHWDRKTKLVYTVVAANYKEGSYQLAGKYFGGGGSVTLGVGVGAQGLIGGGDKSISLQPALTGSKGTGLAAGLTYLYLEPDK